MADYVRQRIFEVALIQRHPLGLDIAPEEATDDICNHQEHHPGGGFLPQPKAGLKRGGKPPPPTVATAPLRADGEGPFSKDTVQSLL